ncbi:PadR family transcriptional regulator [Camelliibacillus cellulosilyticus]|uniref:PadR family transcriptional regulator n=1 Tax=Camelliibacillus cellulosilyticus TaxID=2174486 RepID=A0ABV9GL16_9BACL
MSLRYALLGLLMKREATGYELAQQFKEKMIYFWRAHHTQIYRELAKLEKEGLIDGRVVRQTDHPDKKIYKIAEPGQNELFEWLNEKSAEPLNLKDSELLRVALFDFVDRERAITFLENSKAYHTRIYQVMKDYQAEHIIDDGSYKEKKLGEYLTSEFGVRYMKTWMDWCDWAIAVIKKGRA